MSLTGNNGLLAAAGANQPAYSIERSVVLDTNSYFTRTAGTATSNDIGTFSFWAKRGNLGGGNSFFSNHADSSNRTYVGFDADKITMYGKISNSTNVELLTTQVFRDSSAWYHIVIAVDVTQSTASNRVKIYVNGTQVTDFSTSTYPAQNTDLPLFSKTNHQVGAFFSSSIGDYYNGYLAEYHYIDGQALAPASFGETNEDTNQWQAIKYTGSYGNNGFYLDFATRATDPIDASGNGNNLSSVNVIAGDWKIDSPTNNFCTLNPLNLVDTVTLSEGNLKAVTSTSPQGSSLGTISISSGQWYWEVLQTSANANNDIACGVMELSRKMSPQATGGDVYPNSYLYGNDGMVAKHNSTTSTVNTYGAGDIIGWALDLDGNTLKIYKNNSLEYTYSSGVSGTFTPLVAVDGSSGQSVTHIANFGQDSSFNGEKTAQGNGGDGEDFYYTPPTGYKALNTDNLDDPSIVLPTDHFNTILYTGNGGTQALTGVGFAPNFFWNKNRTGTYQHMLYNTISGATKYLSSSEGDAEATDANSLTSFDSDGVTLGSSGSSNATGVTSVGWNWKGNDTPSKTFAVTVTNPGSGNRYTLDGKVSGTNAMPITIEEGGTYTFDQSDNSNSGHPLRFSTTANGTHGGGSEYTTGVTVSGTPGSAGAKTVITVAASAATLYFYCTAHSGMGAQASTPGSGGGVSDLSGTIASVVNANTTAGFSIATYTGNGTSPSTIGHGLSVAPEMVMVKNRTTNAENWVVSIGNITGTNGDFLILNTTSAVVTGTSQFPSQPGSSTFAVTDAANVNTNTSNYIAYCFHSVDGYSKVGSYTGNGNADGPMIYTGMSPAFVLVRKVSGDNWAIYDNARDPYNVMSKQLYPDSSSSEETSSARYIDFVSNGIKIRGTNSRTNTSGETYIYLAFAESPLKYANAR